MTSGFGPAADEDLHLDSPRMSMLGKEEQVEALEAWAKTYGSHLHRNATSVPVPVEAGEGEVWVTVCTGPAAPEADIQGEGPETGREGPDAEKSPEIGDTRRARPEEE
jgi:hypothetical protein